jgi:hypothetical protein
LAKLPKGKDVTEWVIAGGTREQLDAMVKAATVADLETDPGDQWDAPIPLDQPALPPFPREALSSWLGDHAEALAQATETPLELPAMLDLSVVATSCARKFVVTPEPGYSEPLNIFIAVAMESGSRKTSTMAEATAPLTAWEREMQDQTAPEIARISSKRKTLEMRIDQWSEKATVLGSMLPITQELGVMLRECRGFGSTGMESQADDLFEASRNRSRRSIWVIKEWFGQMIERISDRAAGLAGSAGLLSVWSNGTTAAISTS